MPAGPFIDPSEHSLPPRAVLLVTPITIFFGLALTCIGLRLWAKRIKKTSLRFSDYAILVAAVFGAGYFTICWLGKGKRHRAPLMVIARTDPNIQLSIEVVLAFPLCVLHPHSVSSHKK